MLKCLLGTCKPSGFATDNQVEFACCLWDVRGPTRALACPHVPCCTWGVVVLCCCVCNNSSLTLRTMSNWSYRCVLLLQAVCSGVCCPSAELWYAGSGLVAQPPSATHPPGPPCSVDAAAAAEHRMCWMQAAVCCWPGE
jgi:hypothetical protein